MDSQRFVWKKNIASDTAVETSDVQLFDSSSDGRFFPNNNSFPA